jgi:uncharacterized cupredoxin-like copper-binding protein
MRRILVGTVTGIALLVFGISWGYAGTRPAGTTFSFRLTEMSLGGTGALKAASGKVTFKVHNAGTVEHELVVFKGSGPLVLKKYKGVEAGRWLGEVEETEPGKTGTLTLTLKAGRYLLACNIPGHYQLGMHRLLIVS